MLKFGFLLRGFFPSWRFYDQVPPKLLMEVKTDSNPSFVTVYPKELNWNPAQLFFAPSTLWHHQMTSLLQQFFQELDQNSELTQNSVYPLLCEWVSLHLPEGARSFEFRIRSEDNSEALFASPPVSGFGRNRGHS